MRKEISIQIKKIKPMLKQKMKSNTCNDDVIINESIKERNIALKKLCQYELEKNRKCIVIYICLDLYYYMAKY